MNALRMKKGCANFPRPAAAAAYVWPCAVQLKDAGPPRPKAAFQPPGVWGVGRQGVCRCWHPVGMGVGRPVSTPLTGGLVGVGSPTRCRLFCGRYADVASKVAR